MIMICCWGREMRYDYDVDGVERERYEVVVVYDFMINTHTTRSRF